MPVGIVAVVDHVYPIGCRIDGDRTRDDADWNLGHETAPGMERQRWDLDRGRASSFVTYTLRQKWSGRDAMSNQKTPFREIKRDHRNCVLNHLSLAAFNSTAYRTFSKGSGKKIPKFVVDESGRENRSSQRRMLIQPTSGNR